MFLQQVSLVFSLSLSLSLSLQPISGKHGELTCVIEVFALGPAEMRNKNYIVSGPKLRMGDIATLFSKITDKPAIYDPISVTEYADLAAQEVGKGFKEDIRQMIEWISVAPDEKVCYGAFDPAEDSSWEDLHLKGSSFEDWLKRSGWNGPHFTPT